MLATVGHEGDVFNVGTGEATSVLALHRACRSIAGSTDEPVFASARIGDVSRSVLDVSRATAELGWHAGVSLDDGLRRTWEWMTAR